jgi:hypothetical protein
MHLEMWDTYGPQQAENQHNIEAITVTDGAEGVCVDPGEMGAILEAGGPGLPRGGKGGQLASDSGGG